MRAWQRLGAASALLALTGVAAATMWWLVQREASSPLRITESAGAVRVKHDGREVAAAVGRALGADDVVSTGTDGRAELAFGPDGRIRLAPETSVQVRSADADGVRIELEGGAVQATVRPGSGVLRVGSHGRELQSADAEFDVALTGEDLLVAEVKRGVVRADGVDGVSTLEAGQRVSAPGSGAAVLQPIAADLLLAVEWPDVRQKTRAPSTIVRGATVPGARVRVVGGEAPVEVRADASGQFSASVRLIDGRNPLQVVARDPFGRSASVDGVTVERDARAPQLRGETTYSGASP